MPRWSNVITRIVGRQRVDGAPPRAAAQAEAVDEQDRRPGPALSQYSCVPPSSAVAKPAFGAHASRNQRARRQLRRPDVAGQVGAGGGERADGLEPTARATVSWISVGDPDARLVGVDAGLELVRTTHAWLPSS